MSRVYFTRILPESIGTLIAKSADGHRVVFGQGCSIQSDAFWPLAKLQHLISNTEIGEGDFLIAGVKLNNNYACPAIPRPQGQEVFYARRNPNKPVVPFVLGEPLGSTQNGVLIMQKNNTVPSALEWFASGQIDQDLARIAGEEAAARVKGQEEKKAAAEKAEKDFRLSFGKYVNQKGQEMVNQHGIRQFTISFKDTLLAWLQDELEQVGYPEKARPLEGYHIYQAFVTEELVPLPWDESGIERTIDPETAREYSQQFWATHCFADATAAKCNICGWSSSGVVYEGALCTDCFHGAKKQFGYIPAIEEVFPGVGKIALPSVALTEADWLRERLEWKHGRLRVKPLEYA